MKTVIFSLTFFFSLLSFAQSPWSQLREETIPAASPVPGVQQIALQLVVDETSEWARPGEVQSQIGKARGIFRQCGVDIGKVQIRYVRYSQATVDALNKLNPYKGPSELLLTQGELSETRPTVFLIGTQIADTAKAFNETSISRLGSGSPVDVTPLKFMSLISGNHRTNATTPGCSASYSNLAHELAHILGNIDHIDEADNLMSSRTSPNSKSGHLNPTQCDQIRTYSLAHFSNLQSKVDCP